MNVRGRLALFTAVGSVLVLSTLPAFAKGPAQAVITGPGLAQPITVGDLGSNGVGSDSIGQDLAELVERSGFFTGMWGGRQGRLRHRPTGDLGPRYTITYTMLRPHGGSDAVVQYIYPFADPRPVTYMPANQTYWKTYRTKGAWFAPPSEFAGTLFKQTLFRLGLPQTPPSSRAQPRRIDPEPTLRARSVAIWLWSASALVVIVLAGLLLKKRRATQTVPV
jgi:hypothetical protein